MSLLLLALILLLVLDLIILGLVAWNAARWPKPEPSRGGEPHSCSVLIPARNEEANLGPCLETVLMQGGAVSEILVGDDRSEDGTAKLAREYALREPIITLIQIPERPDGWMGKSFACRSLAGAAHGKWLLFLDADARLSSGAVASIIDEAERRGLSFLSCWPGITLVGFWERLLMPMLNFVVFTLYPAPLSIRRRDPSLGLGHGACILVSRSDYEELGGHDLVRDQMFEDTRLARLWRQSGKSGLCLDGQEVVKVRMYGSFGEIWRGFQKNFYPAFSRPFSFWLFLILHLLLFTLPFGLAPVSPRLGWAAFPLWGAIGSVWAMRAIQARQFRYPLWPLLAHPLVEVLLVALGLSSWWKWRFGSGVEWKGRIYQHGNRR